MHNGSMVVYSGLLSALQNHFCCIPGFSVIPFLAAARKPPMCCQTCWAAAGRDYDAALAHFAAMLHCPRSAPYWQAQYLRQFLDCVAQAAAVRVRHSCSLTSTGTLSNAASPAPRACVAMPALSLVS